MTIITRVFSVENVTTARSNHRPKQRGYMLITLTLAMVLITIGLLAVLPDIAQQIRRDREEELRHRGTEYMRAIQRYYRKFGRYPSRLEDLENTNNIRFLRKRYKDPMSRDPQTGREQDFKLMHPQDVLLNNGPVTGQVLGQLSLVGQAGSATGAGGSGQGLGSQGAGGVQNALGQMGGLQTPQSGLQSQNTGSGSLDNSDSSNSGTSSPSSSGGGSGLSGQVFGGGPIVGVASASKAKTIKEFNKKDHYNDWYFIYVYSPNVPVQGLLIGPWQPNKMIMGGDAIGQPIDGGGQGITQPANGQPPAGPGVSPQSLPAQQNQN